MLHSSVVIVTPFQLANQEYSIPGQKVKLCSYMKSLVAAFTGKLQISKFSTQFREFSDSIVTYFTYIRPTEINGISSILIPIVLCCIVVAKISDMFTTSH